MKEFHKLEVGQQFTLFPGKTMIGQTSAIFEVLHGSMFVLSVYLPNMTEEEKILLREGRITTKVITEENFVLTLLEFGINTDFVFEVSFDPTLYQDGRLLDIFISNMVLIVGIDSTNNTVQVIRYVSTPLKLFQLWINYWKKAIIIDNYSQKFKEWVDKLEQQYTTVELWRLGFYMGKMGQQEDKSLIEYLFK